MKGDNSRETFSREKHYSAVRRQQGRIDVDADANEQVGIQQHHDRVEAKDVIGPVGVPVDDPGFELQDLPFFDDAYRYADMRIKMGRMYVDGILCEHNEGEAEASYCSQPHLVEPPYTKSVTMGDGSTRRALDLGTDENQLNPGITYVVYADVWDRHVTWIEDDGIREVALGGPDTATRVQTVWQLKIAPKDTPFPARGSSLAARTSPTPISDDLCNLTGTTGYRGLENQLYRVEIHNGGVNAEGTTFKWSRDNGSVAGRWLESITGAHTIRVEVAGGTVAERFVPGSWIELTGDKRDLVGRPGILARVLRAGDDRVEYDRDSLVVPSDMALADPETIDMSLFGAHARVRRWDGFANVQDAQSPEPGQSDDDGKWLSLEDGIEVHFWQPRYRSSQYATGDYWVIPARSATHTIDWPTPVGGWSVSKPPLGIDHHYAILAELTVVWYGYELRIELRDQRPLFCPLTRVGCGEGGDIPRPGQYRCYQVDPVNGDDETAVVGISDTSLAESVERGGVHRFSTFAGLAARFPRFGNDSYATILIGSSSTTDVGNYQEALNLQPVVGYRDVMIRASDLTGSDADWRDCLARRLTEFVVVEGVGAGGDSVFVNRVSGAAVPQLGEAWRGARVVFTGVSNENNRYAALDAIYEGPTEGNVIAEYQLVLASFLGAQDMPQALEAGDHIALDTQGISMPALNLSGASSRVYMAGIKVNTALNPQGSNTYHLAFMHAPILVSTAPSSGMLIVSNFYSYAGVNHAVGPCALPGGATTDFASVEMYQAMVYGTQVFHGPGRVSFYDCRIVTNRSTENQFINTGLIVESGTLGIFRGTLRSTVRVINARATMASVYLQPIPLNRSGSGGSIPAPPEGDRMIYLSGVGSSLIIEGMTGGLTTNTILVSMCPNTLHDVQGSVLNTSYGATFVLSNSYPATVAYVEMADRALYVTTDYDVWDHNGNHYRGGFNSSPQGEHGFTLLLPVQGGTSISPGRVLRLSGDFVDYASATETTNIIGVSQNNAYGTSGGGSDPIAVPVHVVSSGCVLMVLADDSPATPAVVYTGADGAATTDSTGARIGVLMQLIGPRSGWVKLD